MTDTERWISVGTVARDLNVSKSTVYRLIKDKTLIIRRPSAHTTQINKLSVCQACSPGREKYPLDCTSCKPAI